MHGKHSLNNPEALYGCLFIHIRMCAWVLAVRKCLYFNTLFVWMEKGSINKGVLDLGLFVDPLKNEM